MAVTPAETINLLARLEYIVANPESIQKDLLRQRFREVGRKLSRAMKIPVDTARRLQSTTLELPAAFIGVRRGYFSALAAQDVTMNVEELAEKT